MAVIYELPDGLTPYERRRIQRVVDLTFRNVNIRSEYPPLRDAEGAKSAMNILAKKYKLARVTICQIVYDNQYRVG